MDTVYLFTENYFICPRLKNFVKKFLGKNMRGPQAVELSLTKGLTELHQPFKINKTVSYISVACVLSGVKTLEQVIEWKKQGRVGKILAGPNLIITPNDFNKIIQDPNIDILLVPSKWSGDFHASIAPDLSSKIRIWPAGVNVPVELFSQKTVDFLIYNKISNNPLVKEVLDFLNRKGFSFQVLNYGQFQQKDFFSALGKCKFLIYLSESESQGLALFEAWARNVPALVWERGFWKYGEYSWRGNTASPYVTSQNGKIFKDIAELEGLIYDFVKTEFNAKDFVLQGFTFKKSAEKYMEIHKTLEK